MADFVEFCRELRLTGTPEEMRELAKHFDESSAHCRGVPHFLSRAYRERYLPWTGIAAGEVEAEMDRLEALCAENRNLQIYAWHLHAGLYLYHDTMYQVSQWPGLENFLGESCGVWDLMIALSAVEGIETAYAAQGLPADYAREAARWLGGACDIFRSAHAGRPGFDRRQWCWLRFHHDGTLHRIGRFEYRDEPDNSGLPLVFRHRATGRLAVFCRDGWLLDGQGFRVRDAASAVRTCTCTREGSVVSGVRILPSGRADTSRVVTMALPPEEWEELFKAGDFIAGLHIPAGGRMTLEVARESFCQARDFFRRYFQRELLGVKCESWILNPALGEELPDSNLAAFMREVHLYPVLSGTQDGLFFVFGRDDGDPLTEYVFDNSLRCGMKRLLERAAVRSGGMFLSAAEFDGFGKLSRNEVGKE